jgi:hypothetical protein
MNRLLRYLLVLTALVALSCQKGLTEDDYASVKVAVQVPGTAMTKAFGDGLSAGNLVLAVFDETGAELPELRQGDWTKSQTEITFNSISDSGKPQTFVNVRLVKGKTYTIVLWAQNKGLTCYDFSDMNNIKVDYTKDNTANIEARDAFYACVSTGEVEGDVTVEAELYRPFAQLNIGTDPEDFVAARAAGLDVDNLYVSVSVSRAATRLQTDHADLSYEISTSDSDFVTAQFAPGLSVISENHSSADRQMLVVKLDDQSEKTYEWVGVNYLLTSVDPDETREVTITLYEGTPENPTKLQLVSYEVGNVPLVANRRTHIAGNLLTSVGELEVFVSPGFLND